MIFPQGGEHARAVRGVEDALDDRVVAVVEGVAGHGVHQADIGAAGDIPLAEHDAAQVVLADDRDAPPVPVTERDATVPFPDAELPRKQHAR